MTTPNMGLSLPVPGSTAQFTWATMLNAALTSVDAHDHTSGNGVPITPAALNMNADLPMGGNNVTLARSYRLSDQGAQLNGTGDLRCLYSFGGALYYNNGSGSPIQLTIGSSINTGALATNVYSPQSITSNTALTGSESWTHLRVSTNAPRTVTLPQAGNVSAGRYYVVQDVTGSAATNNVTIARAGSDTINGGSASLTIAQAYGAITFVSDGVSAWTTIRGFPDGIAVPATSLSLTGSTGFPALATTRTKTARSLAAAVYACAFQGSGPTFALYGALPVVVLDNSQPGLAFALPGIHAGATLTSVAVQFYVDPGWSGVPTGWPSLNVLAVNASAVPSAITSTANYSPEVLGTWTNGALKTITTGAGGTLDPTNNSYYVNLLGPSGGSGSTPKIYVAQIIANYSAIASLQFPW